MNEERMKPGHWLSAWTLMVAGGTSFLKKPSSKNPQMFFSGTGGEAM